MERCVCCGQEIPNGTGIIYGTNLFCSRCNTIFNTCYMCKHKENCEFQDNPDPMPQVIIKTIQNQGMTMQGEAPNPERIEKFCRTCNCFSEEFGCLKKIGCCSNYDEIDF